MYAPYGNLQQPPPFVPMGQPMGPPMVGVMPPQPSMILNAPPQPSFAQPLLQQPPFQQIVGAPLSPHSVIAVDNPLGLDRNDGREFLMVDLVYDEIKRSHPVNDEVLRFIPPTVGVSPKTILSAMRFEATEIATALRSQNLITMPPLDRSKERLPFEDVHVHNQLLFPLTLCNVWWRMKDAEWSCCCPCPSVNSICDSQTACISESYFPIELKGLYEPNEYFAFIRQVNDAARANWVAESAMYCLVPFICCCCYNAPEIYMIKREEVIRRICAAESQRICDRGFQWEFMGPPVTNVDRRGRNGSLCAESENDSCNCGSDSGDACMAAFIFAIIYWLFIVPCSYIYVGVQTDWVAKTFPPFSNGMQKYKDTPFYLALTLSLKPDLAIRAAFESSCPNPNLNRPILPVLLAREMAYSELARVALSPSMSTVLSSQDIPSAWAMDSSIASDRCRAFHSAARGDFEAKSNIFSKMINTMMCQPDPSKEMRYPHTWGWKHQQHMEMIGTRMANSSGIVGVIRGMRPNMQPVAGTFIDTRVGPPMSGGIGMGMMAMQQTPPVSVPRAIGTNSI